MRRRYTRAEEPRLPPYSILNIRSKLVHSIISSFVPKQKLLRIAKNCKRYQNLCEIKIEDYEVYHILKSNIRKKFSLSERPLESALRTMKNIFELTKSELLFENHTEINVPTPIYSLVQMKNYQIIAATEESLLVIEFNQKKNTFIIDREIKIKGNGVFSSLIDIGNNLLLASTLFQGFVISLDTDNVVFELNGRCPIPLRDGRIAYIINEKYIRITKMNEVAEDDEIPIALNQINEEEDTTEYHLIKDGIQLRNGNILLISYDKSITEYDIKSKQCIQIIQTSIDFMETCYELKDGRIGITANDKGNIYLINKLRLRNENMIMLTGHNNTVIKILQLENEQIISSSYDGKVKIWYKLIDGNFNCAMTLFLFEDYIRAFLFMDDGRILITGDDKTLRALGVKNHIGNFTIEFQPEDKKQKIIKSFQLIDNRIH
jgi:WD40 repeat protein